MDIARSLAFVMPSYQRGDEAKRWARQLFKTADLFSTGILFINDESSHSWSVHCDEEESRISCVAPGENLGPAGAMSYALARHAEGLTGADWLVRLDDDRLPSIDVLSQLAETAIALKKLEPRTAAVGLQGSVWNHRQTRLGPGDGAGLYLRHVDYLKTGYLPLYHRDTAVRVGGFRADFFFGMTEVEYGRRIRQAGLLQWETPVEAYDYLRSSEDPALAQRRGWRRYYSVRNHVRMHLEDRRHVAAASTALVRGLISPTYRALARRPGARDDMLLSRRGVIDAYLGRLGRTVDPFEWSSLHGALEGGKMPPT